MCKKEVFNKYRKSIAKLFKTEPKINIKKWKKQLEEESRKAEYLGLFMEDNNPEGYKTLKELQQMHKMY